RANVLELNARDTDAPLFRDFIEHHTKPAIDFVPAGQTCIKAEVAHDVTQGCLCDLLHGRQQIRNSVGSVMRIEYLIVDYARYIDRYVVRGDDGLRLKTYHLLPQIEVWEHL